MSESQVRFRLMTYNIGGGRKDYGSLAGGIAKVIKEASADILLIQEAMEYKDADGIQHGIVDQIAEAGNFGKNAFFGRTLSLGEHMHVQRAILVSGIFNDWKDWEYGNAMFSRWEFVRLGDALKPGEPRNIPLYSPPVYEGNRDTDPRYALLARINKPPVFPFVVGVHFTTLTAERRNEGGFRALPSRIEQAQIVRFKQARRLLDLLREHVLETKEVVFLLGDFNAIANEPCISSVLVGEGGFTRLTLTTAQGVTHPKVSKSIDHIFVYPRDRLIDYRCWIADSSVARKASDHLPVIADAVISCP